MSGCTEFKADFHCISIRARKDPDHKWYDFPYLATDDALAAVLKRWLEDWCITSDLSVRSSKSVEMQKKEAVRLRVQHLAKKWKKEIEDRDRVEAERSTKE